MIKKPRHIHFVGIKGVGVAALAIVAKQAGIRVTGSDIAEVFITDDCLKQAQIDFFEGFSAMNVANPDLVITTGAHGGFDNEEVQAAKTKGIKVLTQGEAVGVFMQGSILGKSAMKGISIAGSHGKTTTTAMIATILQKNALDPSFVIGTGMIPSLGLPGHFGKGTYFVAEADEYATEPKYDRTPKILWQHPMIAVFTNIELDHPDLYASVSDIEKVFTQFVNAMPTDGTVIACGDDSNMQHMLPFLQRNVITYGFSPRNTYVIKSVRVQGLKTAFLLEHRNMLIGEFVISIPGEHVALDALAAIITSVEIGVSFEKAKQAIKAYTGSKRRFEFIGTTIHGAFVYDDYAHHPTEIRKTLRAFRQSFPKKKIVCIFQPHTYSRTKKLFEQFMHSFYEADIVIIANIYPSLREKPDLTISSQRLVEAMHRFYRNVLFLPTHHDMVEYINKKAFLDDTVIITMGAGDLNNMHKEIVK